MSEEKEFLQNAFAPIDDPKEQTTLFKEAVSSLASVMVWTKNQENLIKTHVVHLEKDGTGFAIWQPKDVDGRKFITMATAMKPPLFFFSVSLARANIFFSALFRDISETGIRFFKPAQIFKVQRRKDFRLPIPAGYVVRVEFDDPVQFPLRANLKIADISAGGLSFLIEEDDLGAYPKGAILQNMVFRIRGRDIHTRGEVRDARAIETTNSPVKLAKVGIQFVSLQKGDDQVIASYVFEESRKYFSKFLYDR